MGHHWRHQASASTRTGVWGQGGWFLREGAAAPAARKSVETAQRCGWTKSPGQSVREAGACAYTAQHAKAQAPPNGQESGEKVHHRKSRKSRHHSVPIVKQSSALLLLPEFGDSIDGEHAQRTRLLLRQPFLGAPGMERVQAWKRAHAAPLADFIQTDAARPQLLGQFLHVVDGPGRRVLVNLSQIGPVPILLQVLYELLQDEQLLHQGGGEARLVRQP